jgi:hypothetical protein
LSTLSLGEQFVYEFDFGDSWTHLCTVGPAPDRSGVRGRDRASLSASVLGMGGHPRPVRPQVGRRRRGEPGAAESGFDRSAAAAAVVGAAGARLSRRLGVAGGVVFVGHW